MVLGLIDLILTLVVIISVLFALYRGLVRELLGIAAWLLAGFAALYSYKPLQPLMHKMIDNETTAGIVGAALVALAVLVVMTLINAWIAKRLRQSALSGLDRILGLLFGIARAGLLAAICYFAASMIMPPRRLTELEQQNFSLPYVRVMAGWLDYIMPESIQAERQNVNANPAPKIGIDLKQTVKEDLIQYQESDRQSLDDMIDKIAEE